MPAPIGSEFRRHEIEELLGVCPKHRVLRVRDQDRDGPVVLELKLQFLAVITQQEYPRSLNTRQIHWLYSEMR